MQAVRRKWLGAPQPLTTTAASNRIRPPNWGTIAVDEASQDGVGRRGCRLTSCSTFRRGAVPAPLLIPCEVTASREEGTLSLVYPLAYLRILHASRMLGVAARREHCTTLCR